MNLRDCGTLSEKVLHDRDRVTTDVSGVRTVGDPKGTEARLHCLFFFSSFSPPGSPAERTPMGVLESEGSDRNHWISPPPFCYVIVCRHEILRRVPSVFESSWQPLRNEGGKLLTRWICPWFRRALARPRA